QTTSSITFDKDDPTIGTGDEVRVALERLNGIGKGNVLVTRDGNVFTVVFRGTLAGSNVAALTGSTGVSVATATQGASASESRKIVSNTNDSLTVDGAWSTVTPAVGDLYQIVDSGGQLYKLKDKDGNAVQINGSYVTFSGDISSIVAKTFTD